MILYLVEKELFTALFRKGKQKGDRENHIDNQKYILCKFHIVYP